MRPYAEKVVLGEITPGRDDRLLIPATDAAALLGISRVTLYDMMRRRGLPSVKIGRRRLFSPKALEAYVDGIVGAYHENDRAVVKVGD